MEAGAEGAAEDPRELAHLGGRGAGEPGTGGDQQDHSHGPCGTTARGKRRATARMKSPCGRDTHRNGAHLVLMRVEVLSV